MRWASLLLGFLVGLVAAQTVKFPFKSIKLGDDLQRVLLRYGLPDEIVYYNPLTLQVANTPTRNLILRYHRTRNIEFTTLGDKVVRIFIFFLLGQETFNQFLLVFLIILASRYC
jgi:hypothetical protein